jgi:hypothetical protein
MHSDPPLRYTTRIMAEHLASEPLAPPAATAPPMLAVERPDVAHAPSPAPWPDPAAFARDVTTRLTPLIDRALQRAVAPLAHTIAQQTATIDRLATALHALQATLPNPVALAWIIHENIHRIGLATDGEPRGLLQPFWGA